MNILEQLLTLNPFSRPGAKMKSITGIVIHYVGNPGSTGAGNRNYFESLKDMQKTYASAHYIVGLDGEVIQCIPDGEMAYHAGKSYGAKWDSTVSGNNSNFIGIECCHPAADGKFDDKTYASVVELVSTLATKYSIPVTKIFRHYDVCGKICPLYYVAHPEAWAQLQSDIAAELKKKVVSPVENSSNLHKIMGSPILTKSQFLAYEKNQTHTPRLNCSFSELVDLYYEIGNCEGIRSDYALCQAIHETGFFRYGGIVYPSQNNYAGIGATDNTSKGNAGTFLTPRAGVTAQIQLLKAFATNEPLVLPFADEKYKYISRGSAPYVEWLSIPNNPNGDGWASDPNYFAEIMAYYARVLGH